MGALFLLLLSASPSAEEHLARGEAALADLEYGIAAEELGKAAAKRYDEQRLRPSLVPRSSDIWACPMSHCRHRPPDARAPLRRCVARACGCCRRCR